MSGDAPADAGNARKVQGKPSRSLGGVKKSRACQEGSPARTSVTMQAAAGDITPRDTPRNNTVGRNIVAARKFLNLSQGDLARRLDRHRNQVSEWERGVVIPGTERLREISVALGRHIEWFLDEHPEPL